MSGARHVIAAMMFLEQVDQQPTYVAINPAELTALLMTFRAFKDSHQIVPNVDLQFVPIRSHGRKLTDAPSSYETRGRLSNRRHALTGTRGAQPSRSRICEMCSPAAFSAASRRSTRSWLS
jgi:hypothetical protein